VRAILPVDADPETSLSRLEVACGHALPLALSRLSPGKTIDMRTFDLSTPEGLLLLRGLYFAGRGRWLRRWCESYLDPDAVGDGWPDRAECLFRGLGELVGADGRLFVYYEHPALATTPLLLGAGVPPQVTELGWLLWQAGARWFKDWYFPEGWAEGGRKLQGTLPPDARQGARQEAIARKALQAFLARTDLPDGPEWVDARARAERMIEGDP
jgi:hypothetical protein